MRVRSLFIVAASGSVLVTGAVESGDLSAALGSK